MERVSPYIGYRERYLIGVVLINVSWDGIHNPFDTVSVDAYIKV